MAAATRDHYLNPKQARRVYDRVGRLQQTQALYERRALDELVAYADFKHARSVFVAIDLSPRMVSIACRRLARFGDRAQVRASDGSVALPVADAVAFSRARKDASARASLTFGGAGVPALVGRLWKRVWALRPERTGGCRPIDLRSCLGREAWAIEHRAIVTSFGVSSEVVVARPRE